MMKLSYISRSALAGFVLGLFAAQAQAEKFNIPSGDLDAALSAYTAQSGISLVISNDAVKGVMTHGASGDFSPSDALVRLLKGTGFVASKDATGVVAIVREGRSSNASSISTADRIAAAPTSPTSGALLETVTVTSSKIGGDVQNIPISITALSQEQLTQTQTAGGPDLVKQVPNLTFTKTNFTGYSITIRGIGTQAISVTTDPAVAVALNDMPFIRNHFFEQEFYDLSQAEVLRGPQGTLYGRNATAGVVNLVTAKPSDQFEAMASGELGNYHQRRFEGMINLPVVDDRLDIRLAGEWTKRQGYSFNELTDQRIDGRDLWSGRLTIGFKPFHNVQTTLVWEHFSEDDDRMRTAKQLCKTDPIPTEINGTPVIVEYGGPFAPGNQLSQGCQMSSLYSPDAFEVPNGFSLPYYSELSGLYVPVRNFFDPYASTTQSQNLRVIESSLEPIYKAKNDTVEFNADYTITPALTLTSQTGYGHDFLWSTEDYNRFNTAPGAFQYTGNSGVSGMIQPDPNGLGLCPSGNQFNPSQGCNGDPSTAGKVCTVGEEGCGADGVFCDPQLGCSDRLVAQDLSEEHAWQLSQELRLSSNFSGPLNFSFGGNYLHYETEENYYVFVNTLTMYSIQVGASGHPGNSWVPGVSNNGFCLPYFAGYGFLNPQNGDSSSALNNCPYIDPNPISKLNNQGHNYFLSENPYTLNSYAAFGEAYYNVFDDLKLTGGLRWTNDRKHFIDIPSELVIAGYGYPASAVVDQQWDQWTGRFAGNWTPKLDFTDQTLFYGSYAHGYKAGGANPPGAVLIGDPTPVHPLTFKPEFIDAFELGSKNTLLDGSLTFNADVFYYNYQNYQISEIVDRSAINLNFDAHVKGAEIESTYEPLPGLRFNFAGGWEDTALAKGSQAVDLIDRTAGNPDWIVVKPFVTESSNCILPTYVLLYQLLNGLADGEVRGDCLFAYSKHLDPVTQEPYMANPTSGQGGSIAIAPGTYPGFDPLTATNNGEGFDKNLSGNQLPNAPPFTVSFGAQYTMPISSDWAGTLRGDYYWQDYSWARVFNDNPYDRLRGYTNVNLTLIFTNQNGWQVMLYDKNVFDTTAITGDFLNSDDSGLTTNVFLTDPKLIGIRVTKNW
jgi:iron complex outermembrane receptor protein